MSEDTCKQEEVAETLDQPSQGIDANGKKEEKMSCAHKLMLSALLLGNEVSVNFEQLFTLPILQTLGLPLTLVFVPMLVAGVVAAPLVTAIGWLSDKGSNPNRRKGVAVVFAACILFAGLSCLLIGNRIHLNSLENNSTSPSGEETSTPNITKWFDSSGSTEQHNDVNSAKPSTYSSSGTYESLRYKDASLQTESVPISSEFEDHLIHALERISTPTDEQRSDGLPLQTTPSILQQELQQTYSVFVTPKPQGSRSSPLTNPDSACIEASRSSHSRPPPQSESGSPEDGGSPDGEAGEVSSVPLQAVLGMVGFILLDVGFEATLACTRSWMLTCSPRSHHTSVLGKGVLMASLGGIIGSALANAKIDLPFSEFEPEQGQDVVFHAIIQCWTLALVILLGMCLSLVVGYRRLLNKHRTIHKISVNHVRNSKLQALMASLKTSLLCAFCSLSSKKQDPETETIIKHEQCRQPLNKSDHSEDAPLKGETSVTYHSLDVDRSRDHSETESGVPASGSCSIDTESYPPSNLGESKCLVETNASSEKLVDKVDEKTRELHGFSRCSFHQSFKVKVFFVCCSAFFSVGVVYLHSTTVSDFVGKAVYGGQPAGQGDTGSTEMYQAGVRMTAAGFIVYYLVYLLFSSVHGRVLAWLGYKVEFVLVHLLMSGSLALLILTARLEAFFWLVVVAGVQRTCFFVIPPAVMNDVMQAEAEKSGEERSRREGLAMSVVTAMSPLAYLTVFPALGPLEEVTGGPSVALAMAAGCGCLAAASFLSIHLPRKY